MSRRLTAEQKVLRSMARQHGRECASAIRCALFPVYEDDANVFAERAYQKARAAARAALRSQEGS